MKQTAHGDAQHELSADMKDRMRHRRDVTVYPPLTFRHLDLIADTRCRAAQANSARDGVGFVTELHRLHDGPRIPTDRVVGVAEKT